MRLLMIHPGPEFSVADVYRGYQRAFEAQGHQVMTYNTNDRLTFYTLAHMPVPGSSKCDECGQVKFQQAITEDKMNRHMAMKGILEAVYGFWPEVIVFVSAFFTPPELIKLLRSRGHKVVLLHTESPYQDKEQMERGQYATLNLLNDPMNIDAWRELGFPTEYMPHSYDPTVHYAPERPVSYESDFTFIGTAFDSRQKFFHEMDFTGLEVTLGGANWDKLPEEYRDVLRFVRHRPQDCVDNDETARVYRISKTGINFYRREGEEDYNGTGWAMGPREVEMAACGLFFVRDPRPESDEVFEGILPSFSSPEEASDLIKWYVAHDDEREDAADNARIAIEDRTFDNHAAKLMQYLGY